MMVGDVPVSLQARKIKNRMRMLYVNSEGQSEWRVVVDSAQYGSDVEVVLEGLKGAFVLGERVRVMVLR